MRSNTHIAAAIAALLLTGLAQAGTGADSNTQRSTAPPWTQRIGTGHPFSESSPNVVAAVGSPAPAPWSAAIGAGRAALSAGVPKTRPTEALSSPTRTASLSPSIPWSARIGTGHLTTDARKDTESL
jgi:hypothetical protein